ncbi:MAG: hypothetical protein WBE01_04760 [Methyloceanibacter sp.]
MIILELITHFVATGLPLALTFTLILDSVRAIVDSVGAVIAAVVGPVGAIVSSVAGSVGAIVDTIRTISGSINSGTLP